MKVKFKMKRMTKNSMSSPKLQIRIIECKIDNSQIIKIEPKL